MFAYMHFFYQTFNFQGKLLTFNAKSDNDRDKSDNDCHYLFKMLGFNPWKKSYLTEKSSSLFERFIEKQSLKPILCQ